MKGYLNTAKIDYVLFHLNHTIDLSYLLKYDFFVFTRGKINVSSENSRIIFNLSSAELVYDHVKYIDSLPVLFPIYDENDLFVFKGKNLVFNHDLLKSAFYLLSGYQESIIKERDIHNRFPYEDSIQNKMDFANIPLVNYYFEWISIGIERFCEINQIPFKKKQIFKPFALNLTHDVDQVDYHTFKRVLYKIKEFFGAVEPTTTKSKIIKQIIKTSCELLRFNKKENPSWDFDYLISMEKKYNFHSSYYFLTRDLKNQDSDYLFSESRLRELFSKLLSENCEIGIHGTVRSAKDSGQLRRILNSLEENAGTKIMGIRQHRLIYYVPDTLIIQKEAGLVYDTGLGFAEHEGFRNSYCMPYKIFDLDRDQMLDYWEIPLNVMDVTLFYYRQLNAGQILEPVKKILAEVKKFNGVFTLLWHNGFYDEDRFPGVPETYKRILDLIASESPNSYTGNEIIDSMNQQSKYAG